MASITFTVQTSIEKGQELDRKVEQLKKDFDGMNRNLLMNLLIDRLLEDDGWVIRPMKLAREEE